MQKLKHIKLAGLLMTLSWLLLFVFVVQWLLTRYGTEKEILNKELVRQFSDAGMQVMDSTLLINVIDPLMNKTKHIRVLMTHADSSIRDTGKSSSPGSITRIGDPGKQPRVYTINISDSGSKKLMKNQPYRFDIDSGDMVLRSIRLIVGRNSDTAHDKSVFKQMLTEKIDTNLFRKLFFEKMTKQGQNFTVTWISDPGKDSGLKRNSGIFLSSRIFEGSVGAEISRFSWYLIKRIIPQVIFALVLVLMTGAAFLFTFRTLKKQVLLNDLRNDFISNITHELKTPVSTVKVALESLRNFDMKKDPAVANDYLDMAVMEMERFDRLINNVLNISRLEENNHMVTLRVSNLKATVTKVIRTMTPRFEKEQAAITIEAEEEQYLCLMDELFVEGVLINLFDNSLKYAGEKPRIGIALSEDKDHVYLAVSDHGPGIPEQYISKVFDKFFRIPTGDRHNIKGHGLGLSYTAQVMKQHRGAIRVRNLEGGGCAFILTFLKG